MYLTSATVEQGMSYGESRELTGSSFAEDCNDLRQLRSRSNHASTHLQVLQHIHVHNVGVEQQERDSRQRSNEHSSHVSLARELQHQEADCDILNDNECDLAERRERELAPDAVDQGDHEAGRLKQVSNQADAVCASTVDDLDDLRDFDDGGGGDNGDAKHLGHGELHAY